VLCPAELRGRTLKIKNFSVLAPSVKVFNSHFDSDKFKNGVTLVMILPLHPRWIGCPDSRSLTGHRRLAKQDLHASDCFPDSIRQEVAVRLHREANPKMPEQFHDDTRTNAEPAEKWSENDAARGSSYGTGRLSQ
jgi:hypothetical protein